MRMWLYYVIDNKNRNHSVVATSMAEAVRIANELGWKHLTRVIRQSMVNVEETSKEQRERKEDGDASDV